ncbi:MAG: metalloregulator ArsR/SmtB family transcription factor [Gammaproteobacteria bacterium]|nr:metalloregulator ArsR/SmtB family transcription factor [Gammaproteobacteria bacterium]
MSRSFSKKRNAQAARVFSALGDKTRLSLIQKLIDGNLHSITELSEGTDLSRQAVTKHLRILEDVALVRNKKAGRESHFEFCPNALDCVKDSLENISKRWDQSLNRLKLFSENTD